MMNYVIIIILLYLYNNIFVVVDRTMRQTLNEVKLENMSHELHDDRSNHHYVGLTIGTISLGSLRLSHFWIDTLNWWKNYSFGISEEGRNILKFIILFHEEQKKREF